MDLKTGVSHERNSTESWYSVEVKQNKWGEDTGSTRNKQNKLTTSQGFKLKLGEDIKQCRDRMGWSVLNPVLSQLEGLDTS